MKLINPGDILLVADGKSVLARGITLFMKEYCEINHYKYDRIYHHAALAIQDRGETKIAEAIGRGWKIQHIEKAYKEAEYDSRVNIFRPYNDWSPSEIIKLSDLALDYCQEITRYDYFNFVFQMTMILTGVWIGPKGAKAEGRLYCSEGVATIINKIRPSMCDEPWRYNPMDIYLEPGIVKIS